MPNDYFQFKNFRINQRDCGMKVTTESCVFGAILKPKVLVKSPKILDVGSGTGLLSLMMAQRFPHELIHGVELDSDAWKESTGNAESSPWHSTINFFNSSIQDFEKESSEKFDLIISNPPFFKKHLQPTDVKKARAIHADSLPFEELASSVSYFLKGNGEFHVLLPEYEAGVLQKLLITKKLYLNHSTHVYNRTDSQSIFRVINSYSHEKMKPEATDFFIRNNQNEYTEEFIRWLKPFYLHL